MVVPKRHISAFDGLSDKEVLAINNMLVEMISVLKRVLRPEGFNLGINLGKVSGAGVDTHLHVHLVPRWLGDTNFMPILSNTKIISQSLKELYIKVKKELS
jgi:ATP adenylyltransferase